MFAPTPQFIVHLIEAKCKFFTTDTYSCTHCGFGKLAEIGGALVRI